MAEDKYAKFKNEDNGVYYAFYEVEDAFLDTIVPDQAPYLKKDKDGNVIPTKLRDYLIMMVPAIDESGDVLILLSAKQAACGRLTGTDTNALGLWEHFLPAFGKPWENALTREEAKTLRASAKYSKPRRPGTDEDADA